MLIGPRKYLLHEDTLEQLASWMQLRPGMTVVDVGCGLGYLGYTYWPWYGEHGHYLGVDQSLDLLRDAQEATKNWVRDGRATFINGDVYQLPLIDDFADVVMCQALLINLEKPDTALAEMVRVVKPGGLVICQEPDNVLPRVGRNVLSIPELDLEDLLLYARVYLICNKGRIKMGCGDAAIGPKVPHMMKRATLIDVDVRLNDRGFYLEAPYDTPQQQHTLAVLKDHWLEGEGRKTWLAREKEHFLAGGGNIQDYNRYRTVDDRIVSIILGQIADGVYYDCAATSFFFVKGRKPVVDTQDD